MINRFEKTSTANNASALIAGFTEGQFRKVIFYGTAESGGSAKDGHVSNWPLMAVYAEHTNGDVTVYDGLFLTAARDNRYSEVAGVLDAALMPSSCKVYFGSKPLDFTSGMQPDAAAELMLHQPQLPLDSNSRAQYFKLLSPYLTEADFKSM